MVFVKCDQKVKVIVVNMTHRRTYLDVINVTIDQTISTKSLARWQTVSNFEVIFSHSLLGVTVATSRDLARPEQFV
jgi:hypothetical protein